MSCRSPIAFRLLLSCALLLAVACENRSSPEGSPEDSGTTSETPSSTADGQPEPTPPTPRAVDSPRVPAVPDEAFWIYRTGGEVWSDPIFVDHEGRPLLIFGSDDRRLHAVDPRNGEAIWRHRLGGKVRRAPLSVEKNQVAALDEDGVLHVLNLADGQPLGQFPLAPDGSTVAFAGDNATVVHGGSDDTVTARTLDGKQLWQIGLGDGSPARAIGLDSSRVYAVGGDGQVSALDRLSGKRLWRTGGDDGARLDGDTRSAPVAFTHGGRERLFLSGGGFLWCLDAVDGRERWRRLTHEFVSQSPRIHGGSSTPQVLVAGGETLFAFSLDGELRWQKNLEGAFRSGPVGLGDHLAVGSGDHLLALLAGSDGRELWRFETDAFITAALSGRADRLVFGSVGGDLLGVRVDLQDAARAEAPDGRIHVGPTFFDGTPEIVHQLDIGPMSVPPLPLSGGVLVRTDRGPVVLDGDGEQRFRKIWPTAVPAAGLTQHAGQELVIAVDPVGRLVALDAADGSEQWTAPRGGRSGLPVRGLRVSPERRILVHTEDGEVASFSSSGELLWRADVGGIASEPRAHRGSVVVGTSTSEVVALNGDNGRELWRLETRAAVAAPVLSHLDTLFVGDVGGTIYAVDPAIGGIRWQRALGGSFRLPASALYGTVFFCGDDGRLTALEGRSGRPSWRFELGSRCTGAPYPHDGMLYVGAHDRSLHAVNAVNGEELWRLHGAAPSTGAAVGFDSAQRPTVWVGDRSGRLLAIRLP